MIVSDRHRYVFVTCPKNCSHTLIDYLENHCAGELQRGLHPRKIPNRARGYFTFGVVRDPYARAVSAWWNCVAERKGIRRRHAALYIYNDVGADKTLAPFIRYMMRMHPFDGLYTPQTRWYEGIGIDRLIRVESIEDDLQQLPFPTPRVPLKRLNPSGRSRGPWQDYITDEVIELVQQWAAVDFGPLGYARDRNWPQGTARLEDIKL